MRKRVLMSVLLGLCLSPAWAEIPLSQSAPVKPISMGMQSRPDLTIRDDGEAIVVWRSRSGGFGTPIEIRGRRLGADGTPIGQDFQISTSEAARFGPVRVESQPGNGFIVAWESLVEDPGHLVVFRLFDENGQPLTDEVRVVGQVIGEQMNGSLIVDSSGGFLVAWDEQRVDGRSIWARRFNASGEALSAEFRIDHGSYPALAGDGDGGFVVVWSRNDVDKPQCRDVFARHYDAADQAQGEASQISEETGSFPSLAISSEIIATANGFAAVWTDMLGYDGSELGVFGARLDPAGRRVGEPFLVNQITEDIQHSQRLAAQADGGFTVIWESSLEGFQTSIRARHFTEEAEPAGGEFRVDDNLQQYSHEPAVAVDANNRLWTTWQHLEPETGTTDSYHEVLVRRFAAPCIPSADALCLSGRFRLRANWQDFTGRTGVGHAVPVTQDTGTFWFFSPDNLELMVKVLDGRALNDQFWVFYGALSNVAYTLEVTDLVTGEIAIYDNPSGEFASVGDIAALPVLPNGDPGLSTLESPPPPASTCGAETLCLGGDRFRVQVAWRDFEGKQGVGHAVPLTEDSGSFWFFSQNNLELMIKVLDGRAINDHYWVFYGALSNVDYTLTVTDTESGEEKSYINEAGDFGSVGDTSAFADN